MNDTELKVLKWQKARIKACEETPKDVRKNGDFLIRLNDLANAEHELMKLKFE